MSAIELSHVSKTFTVRSDQARSFQEVFLSLFERRHGSETRVFKALDDVSFSVAHGEAVGLIGANGSGKSTCLKLITRIIEPTSGTICVDGRVSALLELGTGFHPELSGRENVFLYGSLLGIGRREMATRFDDIVSFAELERFIDAPVKFYSSGMYVRLAFATAINVSAEILLVDEVLAVGDQSFQARCLERIHDLKRQGVTIFLVSHSLDAVRSVCDRTIWLDDGILRDDGPSETVIQRYLLHVYMDQEAQDMDARGNGHDHYIQPAEAASSAPKLEQMGEQISDDVLASRNSRWGTGEAQILDVLFIDGAGQERLLLTTGEPATIVIRYQTRTRVEQPMFGLAIYRSDGLQISGPNTVFSGFDIPFIEGEGEVRYRIDSLPLLAGTYYVSASICDHSGMQAYDYHDMAYRFRVWPGDVGERYGAIYIPATWEHEPARQGEREALP